MTPPQEGLLASNLNGLFGWLSIIWAAYGPDRRRPAVHAQPLQRGRRASFLATLNALFWLFAIPVLPVWSLIVIAIDVMIIYHLAIHTDVVDK